MTHTPTHVNIHEAINCYCFNPDCKSSIFHPETCNVTVRNLEQLLSEEHYCEHCQDELVAKPILEIKNQIYKLLKPANEQQRLKLRLNIKNLRFSTIAQN